MEAKKRAAKTARISLFNIQRPNQTLQRDSSPPLFHFLISYFFWSDLDSQHLIFVFHFQPNGTWKQSREMDVEKTVERKKSDEIYLYITHTRSQYARRHDTNTQLHKAFKISPTHRPISQFSLTKKIDPFHNLCKFTLTYPWTQNSINTHADL